VVPKCNHLKGANRPYLGGGSKKSFLPYINPTNSNPSQKVKARPPSPTKNLTSEEESNSNGEQREKDQAACQGRGNLDGVTTYGGCVEKRNKRNRTGYLGRGKPNCKRPRGSLLSAIRARKRHVLGRRMYRFPQNLQSGAVNPLQGDHLSADNDKRKKREARLANGLARRGRVPTTALRNC